MADEELEKRVVGALVKGALTFGPAIVDAIRGEYMHPTVII